MDERYTEHVSTESPELIRENECEYNVGTLVTYRFRRLWNEIVDLREQLAAARRTTPNREAIVEEIAEMVDHMGEGRRLEEYVGAIRDMKGGKS